MTSNLPEEFAWELTDEECCASWYVMTRVTEEFRAEKGHYPGMNPDGTYCEGINAEHSAWI